MDMNSPPALTTGPVDLEPQPPNRVQSIPEDGMLQESLILTTRRRGCGADLMGDEDEDKPYREQRLNHYAAITFPCQQELARNPQFPEEKSLKKGHI